MCQTVRTGHDREPKHEMPDLRVRMCERLCDLAYRASVHSDGIPGLFVRALRADGQCHSRPLFPSLEMLTRYYQNFHLFLLLLGCTLVQHRAIRMSGSPAGEEREDKQTRASANRAKKGSRVLAAYRTCTNGERHRCTRDRLDGIRFNHEEKREELGVVVVKGRNPTRVSPPSRAPRRGKRRASITLSIVPPSLSYTNTARNGPQPAQLDPTWNTKCPRLLHNHSQQTWRPGLCTMCPTTRDLNNDRRSSEPGTVFCSI